MRLPTLTGKIHPVMGSKHPIMSKRHPVMDNEHRVMGNKIPPREAIPGRYFIIYISSS